MTESRETAGARFRCAAAVLEGRVVIEPDRRGRPGMGHVLALITDDPVELRSRNERRMFSICREFRIPLPLCNFPIETAGRAFIADFYEATTSELVRVMLNQALVAAEEDDCYKALKLIRRVIQHEDAVIGRLTDTAAGSTAWNGPIPASRDQRSPCKP